MALTPCPECDTEISSQAENCPRCGAPIEQPASAQDVAGVVALVIFGLPLLAGLLWLFL